MSIDFPTPGKGTFMNQSPKVPATATVIFGATGDLTHRKIVPAFYHLQKNGQLPEGFTIIGFARRPKTDEEFRKDLKEALDKFSQTKPVDEEAWAKLAPHIYYQQGDLPNPDDYKKLAERIKGLPEAAQYGENCLFYLATAPNFFGVVADNLAKAGLNPQPGAKHLRRLIVEKPFGTDLESAQKLNTELQRSFPEKSIYRIDHYLGKETVQNLLYFRFGNSIYEPLWNRRYIDHVQITVAETVTVEGRGGYYEEAGASRDMVQNHMMQLLSLLAMEPPASLDAESIRDEKVKVLRTISTPTQEYVRRNSVRAQYGGGQLNGRQIPPYRQEERVAPDSMTETYVALKLELDSWRWAGVPFYLRTGKGLGHQYSEINIVFNRPPGVLFANTSSRIHRNRLRIRIQPNEGIHLHFNTKTPNQATLQTVGMDFHYRKDGAHYFPEAYERLICDALLGESTLFTRSDEVEQAWRVIDAVRGAWAAEDDSSLPLYSPGSMGPVEADELMRHDGRGWAPPLEA
ncbi:MAG: glucose-6-phosphate dehydrogenase [Verrucomicrobium sp.]|nr:glucose-6-phosphate dehydrogenase [Verrucomicrobium sp.]